MNDEMDRLFVLESIEEIKKVRAKYFYYLDHRDWEGWRNEVFCADAVLWVPESPMTPDPYVGIDNILAMMREVLKDIMSVHQGHMPIIEITSPTTATGVWALEDIILMKGNGMELRMHGYGHYHDTYELTANGWRIKTQHMTRLFNLQPLDSSGDQWEGTPAEWMKEWFAPYGMPLKLPQAK